MATSYPLGDAAAARARAWHHAAHAATCDVIEPWRHGTVLRASRYPDFYEFNLVRVEDDPAMSADALARFTDRALAGLSHRRIEFDLCAVADSLRTGFEAKGWAASRLVWMRHLGRAPAGTDARVEPVAYDAVHHLRVAWQREGVPDHEDLGHLADAREVALRRGAQILAVRQGPRAVGYAQLERCGGGAEITQVYVSPDHRGRALGSAMVCSAIQSAGEVADLWICADAEDRPKRLYERLGFRPAWTTVEFLRLPGRTTAQSGAA